MVNRKILPAPSKHGLEPFPVADDTSSSKKRRTGNVVACDKCRKSKVACDGNRPACTRCCRKSFVCDYPTQDEDETRRQALQRQLAELQGRLQRHQDVLHHLQSVSDREALATIQRLKATPNVEGVLDSMRSSIVPQRPSDLQAARALLPFTQSQLEFELIISHCNVYTKSSLFDRTSTKLKDIFQRDQASTPGTVSADSPLTGSSNSSVDGRTPQALAMNPPSPLRGMPEARASPIAGPLRGRTYCDPRLELVDMAHWTKVPVSNDFAASILSVYLETEHPVAGSFDTDTFLDDLIAPRLDFCSPLLVNSVLYFASQCYGSLDPRAIPLSVAFFLEAEALWQDARSSDSIITIAGALMLSMGTVAQGKDEFSLRVLSEGRKMAERLRLFGVPHTEELYHEFRQYPPRTLRAFSHTSWASYTFLSIHASYYQELPIEYPPILPIPGDDTHNSTIRTWPVHSQPSYMGHTFAAWCKLWTIAQQVMVVYHRKDAASLRQELSLAFVEGKYQELLHWADSFPDEWVYDENSRNHIFVFHAFYHTLVLDLFRPFLKASADSRLQSFSSFDSSPQTVFDASFRQLLGLLVNYCARCDTRLYNFFFNGAVLHIIHILLHDTTISDWQFYFGLCMTWMKEIFLRYAAIGKAVEAQMTIGLKEGSIASAEARSFLDQLRQRDRHHALADAGLSCIVDFDVAISSKNEGRAQALAQQLDELLLFDELTTGTV